MIDREIEFGEAHLRYNHPHDLAGIIECYVLNVYNVQKIKRGSVVIDVGSGIGEFAVLASARVGREGRVIAIEPSPDDFRALETNIRENGCSNVIPINAAISDKEERQSIGFKGRTFGARADTLHNIIHNLGVSADSIHFVKMDIEGGERRVIPSSIDLIRNVDYLAIEIHEGYSTELIPFMGELGFRFKRIKRSEYLLQTIETAITHPVSVYRLWKAFRSGGESPGLAKTLSGIDISTSDELVVGLFFKDPPNDTAPSGNLVGHGM